MICTNTCKLLHRWGCNRGAHIGKCILANTRWMEGITAASTFAGDSILGSLSIEITLTRIPSTDHMGLHLSSGFSCSLYMSTPG
ncbi:hypothetical protein POVWA2_017530 [Plasmodium ovale wallikeri]|uniref:Uncharacterized protein n=1 Tax=Plasmodium ovale wallikeri TaxID=864142 RepID=A0A1A8YQ29_PLAOA|nr:hypothetical protein POVWA1_017650 [Plasmodium ovale wallikeri]SBT33967.1 hypothetical protein POVWA2_017530 [Plasmodium ovale wallikeri]